MSIDWGSVADWASAVGSLAAVVVALGLAIRDSRKWHREAEENDRVQARMVFTVAHKGATAFENGEILLMKRGDPTEVARMIERTISSIEDAIDAILKGGIRDPKLLDVALRMKSASSFTPALLEFFTPEGLAIEIKAMGKDWRELSDEADRLLIASLPPETV